VFPQSEWQRCAVHFYRNVFNHVHNGKVAEVACMLKAIHAQENRKAAQAKATEIVARLKELKLRTAAELVEQKVVEP
jgi:transposase-like protein